MASRATARVQIATVLVLFALTFSLLQWFGYRQKSATWDEPIHLAAGYAALAEGDYRLEGTHPPFIRMWAALPLLFMDGIRLDTAVIDRTPPAEWHSGGTALSYGTKFLYIDNDGDRLLNAARFMIVLCSIPRFLLPALNLPSRPEFRRLKTVFLPKIYFSLTNFLTPCVSGRTKPRNAW